MKQVTVWVLAAVVAALTLAGTGAFAQPAENEVVPPGALTLPAAPPLTIADLVSAGEFLNATPGWQAPNAREGSGMMSLANSMSHRADRHARHARLDEAATARREAINLYWGAHRILQIGGSAYEFARAALVAGHREVACAIFARLADRGGYPGMPTEALRQQMSGVAACDPAWRLPDPTPVGPLPASQDSDGDGILDDQDVCIDVPAGPTPDPASRGCPIVPPSPPIPPRDTDGDGVSDVDDACASVPSGPNPDPARLGCPLRTPVVRVQLEPRSVIHTVGPWAMIGLGVASLTLGIVEGVAVLEHNTVVERAPVSGLPSGSRQDGEDSATVANLAFGFGAVAVVGAVVWMIARPPATTTRRTITLLPHVVSSRDGLILGLNGTF